MGIGSYLFLAIGLDVTVGEGIGHGVSAEMPWAPRLKRVAGSAESRGASQGREADRAPSLQDGMIDVTQLRVTRVFVI